MMKINFLLLILISMAVTVPQTAWAHRSGCHNLHTCPSDSDTYVCGDLGYPCNGVTSINDIDPATIAVPLVAESIFDEFFSRKPTSRESNYWKNRFRTDKDSVFKLRRAMAWHKARGSFGPSQIVRRVSPLGLVKKINSLFRASYDGRNPTISENQYWITRVEDKSTEQALMGAMLYHRLRGIQH